MKNNENKELVTLIAHDFFNVASALVDVNETLITDDMEDLREEVFSLEERDGRKYLEATLEDIIPALNGLKVSVDQIPDHPYYRSSLNRLKSLYEKGYENAEEVYAAKLRAENNTLLGATADEIENARELMNNLFAGLK